MGGSSSVALNGPITTTPPIVNQGFTTTPAPTLTVGGTSTLTLNSAIDENTTIVVIGSASVALGPQLSGSGLIFVRDQGRLSSSSA